MIIIIMILQTIILQPQRGVARDGRVDLLDPVLLRLGEADFLHSLRPPSRQPTRFHVIS